MRDTQSSGLAEAACGPNPPVFVDKVSWNTALLGADLVSGCLCLAAAAQAS